MYNDEAAQRCDSSLLPGSFCSACFQNFRSRLSSSVACCWGAGGAAVSTGGVGVVLGATDIWVISYVGTEEDHTTILLPSEY